MMSQGDWLIVVVILTITATVAAGKMRKKWRGKQIQRRGRKGEEKAISLLRAEGYHIVSRQVKHSVHLYIDGKCHESRIHADLIAQKGLRRYVVEVKTGKQANPLLAHVRRQLLEYHLVFKPDGMLFVDVNTGRIQVIRFDCDSKVKFRSALGPFMAGAFCTVIIGIALYIF